MNCPSEKKKMMRRTAALGAVFHNAPTVYPFKKPFYDTPYDQDRSPLDVTKRGSNGNPWPTWMDRGADGTGHGIGLHRTHPLSKLRGNYKRTPQHVPRIFRMVTQGVLHKSGVKLYFRGGKPPNPSVHPYLTGEPCAVYGWRVTDTAVIREFQVPHVEKEKMRYKPYVALHERRIIGDAPVASPAKPAANDSAVVPNGDAKEEKPSKPLMKRLFFWK